MAALARFSCTLSISTAAPDYLGASALWGEESELSSEVSVLAELVANSLAGSLCIFCPSSLSSFSIRLFRASSACC